MTWKDLAIAIPISLWLSFVILCSLQGPSCVYPVEAQLQTELNNIEKALLDHRSKTGRSPTTLAQMRAQLEIDQHPNSPLATGRDCWGRQLVILPVSGESNRFTLRSLGKDGTLQLSGGDDLVITFTGG